MMVKGVSSTIIFISSPNFLSLTLIQVHLKARLDQGTPSLTQNKTTHNTSVVSLQRETTPGTLSCSRQLVPHVSVPPTAQTRLQGPTNLVALDRSLARSLCSAPLHACGAPPAPPTLKLKLRSVSTISQILSLSHQAPQARSLLSAPFTGSWSPTAIGTSAFRSPKLSWLIP